MAKDYSQDSSVLGSSSPRWAFFDGSRSNHTEQNQRLQRREKRGPLPQHPALTPGPKLGLSAMGVGVCSIATHGFRTPGFHNYKQKLYNKTTPNQNACETTGCCPPPPHLLRHYSVLLKMDDHVFCFSVYNTQRIIFSLLFKI